MEAGVLTEPVAPPPADDKPSEAWKFDKNGKAYVARGGGKPGTIGRQGDDETVEQARERDAIPKEERRPRRKTKTPKLPPAPRKLDLKKLEDALAEGLKAPGIMCASFGETWGAEHFFASGPYLARNLVLASEHNPWLRSKLEDAAAGEDAMMKIFGIMGIGGALVMYMAPPVIYFLNLGVPDKAREMLNVPPRRDDHAPSSPQPPDQAGQAGQTAPAWAA